MGSFELQGEAAAPIADRNRSASGDPPGLVYLRNAFRGEDVKPRPVHWQHVYRDNREDRREKMDFALPYLYGTGFVKATGLIDSIVMSGEIDIGQSTKLFLPVEIVQSVADDPAFPRITAYLELTRGSTLHKIASSTQDGDLVRFSGPAKVTIRQSKEHVPGGGFKSWPELQISCRALAFVRHTVRPETDI